MQASSDNQRLLQISTVTNEAASSRDQLSEVSQEKLLYREQMLQQQQYLPSFQSVYGNNRKENNNPLEQTCPQIQQNNYSQQPEYQRAVTDIGIVNSSASFSQNKTPLKVIRDEGLISQNRQEIIECRVSSNSYMANANVVQRQQNSTGFLNASPDKFSKTNQIPHLFLHNDIQQHHNSNQKQQVLDLESKPLVQLPLPNSHQNLSPMTPLHHQLLNLSQVFQQQQQAHQSNGNISQSNNNFSPFSGLSAFKHVNPITYSGLIRTTSEERMQNLTRQNEQLRLLLHENQAINQMTLKFLERAATQSSLQHSPSMVPQQMTIDSQETSMTIANLQINRTPSFNQRSQCQGSYIVEIQNAIIMSMKVAEKNQRILSQISSIEKYSKDNPEDSSARLSKISQNEYSKQSSSAPKIVPVGGTKVIMPLPSSQNRSSINFCFKDSFQNIAMNESLKNKDSSSFLNGKVTEFHASKGHQNLMNAPKLADQNLQSRPFEDRIYSNEASILPFVTPTLHGKLEEEQKRELVIITDSLNDEDTLNHQQAHANSVMECSSSFSDSSDLSSIVEDDPSSSSDEEYTERQRLGHVKKATTSFKTSNAIKKTNTSRGEPIRKLRPQVQKNPLEQPQDGDEQFICEKCGEQFTSGWALGGHASRVHPGESEAYRRKIQRRDERVFERELLQLAKQKHQEVFGTDAPINRVKIRKFKRDLRAKFLMNKSTNLNLNIKKKVQ